MQRLRKKSEERLGRAAANATRWIGSTKSLVVHTLLFVISFSLYFWGFDFDKILLVVTTIVSLEAIYLSIFIQMSVNNQAKHLDEVAEDVGEIQEDVEGIEKDIDEIQEDVDEIQEDVGEVDELDQKRDEEMLSKIEGTLQMLIAEINTLKKQQDDKNK